MFYLFEGNRLLFFRITGLPRVSLICEHKSVDYSWLLYPISTLVTPIFPLLSRRPLDHEARPTSRYRYIDKNASPDRKARTASLQRNIDANTWHGE